METWSADRFLDGFEALSWDLADAEMAEEEPAVTLTATLVRRGEPEHARAVLYVHGWNDYFFQAHLADFWARQGFDFYAVDLRRYGRNLRPGLFAGYITDLQHYAAELDGAYDRIVAGGHDLITLMGHSTGGLTAALWAHATERAVNGVVLNSPWLDMQGPSILSTAISPLVSGVAAYKPTSAIQMTDTGLYWQSISDEERGEWHIDRAYKSTQVFAIRFAWVKAILAGQGVVEDGLDIDTPVLAMMSTESNMTATKWDDSLHSVDMVLDCDRLAAMSWRLGRHVTIARIKGGMHDLTLSPHPVRDEVFAEISRWVKTYVR